MKFFMKEEWKKVKGFEDYQVSCLGRVKSFKGKKERILKAHSNGHGYLQVVLMRDKKRQTRKVHKLVAIAFLDHKPNGHILVVDHINDIRNDNRVKNLQIVTQRFNVCKTQGSYSSQYKGVCWDKRSKKWESSIRINYKSLKLGLFTDEQEAYQAYQKALLTLKQQTS